MFQTFPLLGLSLLIYFLLSFTLEPGKPPWWAFESLSIRLMSGDYWLITAGHLFIGFSFVLLFIELLRSTRSGNVSVMNHAFSVMVFIIALLLFVTQQGYGNSIFFLFTLMTLLDFMAGFIITTATTRRDIAFTRGAE